MYCNTLQHAATRCNTLQYRPLVAVSLANPFAVLGYVLQHTATHYNTLQHTGTHCNTLERTTTQTVCCSVAGSPLCSAQVSNAIHYNTVHTDLLLQCHLHPHCPARVSMGGRDRGLNSCDCSSVWFQSKSPLFSGTWSDPRIWGFSLFVGF